MSGDAFDIPGWEEPEPPEGEACPFRGRIDGELLRLALVGGGSLTGTYRPIAGQNFLHVAGDGGQGKVEGPFRSRNVSRVELLRGIDEIRAERRERRLGDPVPGTLRRTRDGYEARLELLARLAASAEEPRRRRQVEAQFDELADEVELAKTKRYWMLAAARWARHSNRPPTKIDLSGGDMTVAERFQPPRPQDFDPDRTVRRARVPRPAHVLADPLSTFNVAKALRRAGFRARVSVLGEMTDDVADLLVDFPGGKAEGRFTATGRRGPDGTMHWSHGWSGNGTRTDETRRIRSMRRPDYAAFRTILREGLAPPPEPVPDPAPRGP